MPCTLRLINWTPTSFEIADLAAERRLRRVEPFLRRQRQAALLGDRNEIAKVPQLHSGFHIFKAYPSTYKVFCAGARGSYLPPQRKRPGRHLWAF
jgi:hypothetical protein